MPGSIFVAAIGNLWQRQSWAKIMDMVEYTNAQGFQCVFQEVTPDRVSFPQGNINAMRDIGIRMGRDAGLEYIAVVDNDTLPEPDTLTKMTHYQAAPAVVSPVIWCDQEEGYVGQPKYELDQGLQPMLWIPASFTVFRANVFNCPDIRYSEKLLETDFAQVLNNYGHTPFLDTNVRVKTTRPPSRSLKQDYALRAAGLEVIYEAGGLPRDRGPTDPDSPYVQDGIYLPMFANGGNNGS